MSTTNDGQEHEKQHNGFKILGVLIAVLIAFLVGLYKPWSGKIIELPTPGPVSSAQPSTTGTPPITPPTDNTSVNSNMAPAHIVAPNTCELICNGAKPTIINGEEMSKNGIVIMKIPDDKEEKKGRRKHRTVVSPPEVSKKSLSELSDRVLKLEMVQDIETSPLPTRDDE